MNPYLSDFMEVIRSERRFESLRFVLDKLESGKVGILELYEEILTPALNEMVPTGVENVDIWKEHVRTSIIKTILENVYPYVIKEREAAGKSQGKTVAVLCPPEEYHDVGARMAADIFALSGYNAIFVGGNTPLRVVEGGLASGEIDYVAISVSNPYHLISTRNMIESIRAAHPGVKVVVGGNAIVKVGERSLQLGADYITHSLEEIGRLEEVKA
ncbi:MAG: cobalamin B12-binding domain-containing protein [Clostridia bacterium]|nr:cobalamin B12-binding domain-containing protein [Clostridia bacterium]NLF21300.1 cobalamin B12-binding domain-containing protein [Clostridiaceae bacterium]